MPRKSINASQERRQVLQEFQRSCESAGSLVRPTGGLPRGAACLARDPARLPQKFLVYRSSADLLALERHIGPYKYTKEDIQDSGNFADGPLRIACMC